ncbi:MAG TPA: vWA domain-containing protein, partial [Lacipirellulaceae bacterium]|nr:vWA domain-containing protein [Lacipirellulaceae bacterium]
MASRPAGDSGTDDVATVEKRRIWWKPKTWFGPFAILRGAPAWLFSLAFHMAALVALVMIPLYLPIRNRVSLSIVPMDKPEKPVEPQEFHFSPDAHGRIGALSQYGLDAARPSAPVQGPESKIEYHVRPLLTQVGSIGLRDIDRTIIESPNLPENLIIKGSGGVGTTGAMGAVDRITHEILLSLDEHSTLVAWLFDQSGSLKPQRESIAKRFDRIYKELGIIQKSGNKAFKHHGQQPLLTVVAEFGNSIDLITPKPTDDLEKIKAAVRSIKDDPKDNGRENVFQSVGYLAEKYRHFRLSSPRRNVMIVVFTDEAGDDIDALDPTVDLCRKYEMPVYVIGVPAPFGRETAYVKWIDPDPRFDQTPQKAPVHQGPESLMPERIMLLFNGRKEDEVQIDSGFGPFGLSRLAYETGGLYFTVHPNRVTGKTIHPRETAAMSTYMSRFFDERVMRNYRPDYVSAKQYSELLKSNRARAALVEAARLSATTEMEHVRQRFPRLDDAQFARSLSIAQRTAAKLEPKLEELVSVLRQGERDREKLITPRWQAGYDLAMGRSLAVKVRTEGYNAML